MKLDKDNPISPRAIETFTVKVEFDDADYPQAAQRTTPIVRNRAPSLPTPSPALTSQHSQVEMPTSGSNTPGESLSNMPTATPTPDIVPENVSAAQPLPNSDMIQFTIVTQMQHLPVRDTAFSNGVLTSAGPQTLAPLQILTEFAESPYLNHPAERTQVHAPALASEDDTCISQVERQQLFNMQAAFYTPIVGNPTKTVTNPQPTSQHPVRVFFNPQGTSGPNTNIPSNHNGFLPFPNGLNIPPPTYHHQTLVGPYPTFETSQQQSWPSPPTWGNPQVPGGGQHPNMPGGPPNMVPHRHTQNCIPKVNKNEKISPLKFRTLQTDNDRLMLQHKKSDEVIEQLQRNLLSVNKEKEKAEKVAEEYEKRLIASQQELKKTKEDDFEYRKAIKQQIDLDIKRIIEEFEKNVQKEMKQAREQISKLELDAQNNESERNTLREEVEKTKEDCMKIINSHNAYYHKVIEDGNIESAARSANLLRTIEELENNLEALRIQGNRDREQFNERTLEYDRALVDTEQKYMEELMRAIERIHLLENELAKSSIQAALEGQSSTPNENKELSHSFLLKLKPWHQRSISQGDDSLGEEDQQGPSTSGPPTHQPMDFAEQVAETNRKRKMEKKMKKEEEERKKNRKDEDQ